MRIREYRGFQNVHPQSLFTGVENSSAFHIYIRKAKEVERTKHISVATEKIFFLSKVTKKSNEIGKSHIDQ